MIKILGWFVSRTPIVVIEEEEALATKAVLLNLDYETWKYFKDGGKGHITRMQNVLKEHANKHR